MHYSKGLETSIKRARIIKMNQVSDFPASLALVGAGKMGGSMLEGWLAVGFPGERIAVFDPNPFGHIIDVCNKASVLLNPDSLPFDPAALILAIKPQALESVAPSANQLMGKDTVLVSILAGKTISNLLERLPRARAVVRTIPNLPASIGRGATGAFANDETSPDQRRMVDALLRTNGLVEWLSSENLIDAVTAVSGSGPAYVFYLTECLAEAGIAAGLPSDLAARLAKATVTGSAELMANSNQPPSALRENVTSPAGTTAAALQKLMAEDGLAPLMRKAVEAARKRAQELAG